MSLLHHSWVFCSTCVPSWDVFSQVANTAKQALERVGGVVANPEIQSHIHTLIEAICDPANRTKIALEHLLGIRFVHTIDAPSLALIMPLLVRGLRERSTDTKKKAAKVNMCPPFPRPISLISPHPSPCTSDCRSLAA